MRIISTLKPANIAVSFQIISEDNGQLIVTVLQ